MGCGWISAVKQQCTHLFIPQGLSPPPTIKECTGTAALLVHPSVLSQLSHSIKLTECTRGDLAAAVDDDVGP